MDENARLKITEIFHSIQGESTLTGERMSFVRTTGCPLRCTYCDTKYAYTGGKWMTIDEILQKIAPHQATHVLITGGEPLAQPNTIHLVNALNRTEKHVLIETGGEEEIGPYAGAAKIIMDIKTPGSGETARNCFRNLDYLLPSDEIKFVIRDREDYEWAKRTCDNHGLYSRFVVLFSPLFEELALRALADWIIADRLNVRLQTQLHKHIWGSESTGI